jgi:hypothetical protein
MTRIVMIITAGIGQSEAFFMTCLTEFPIERSEYA